LTNITREIRIGGEGKTRTRGRRGGRRGPRKGKIREIRSGRGEREEGGGQDRDEGNDEKNRERHSRIHDVSTKCDLVSVLFCWRPLSGPEGESASADRLPFR